MGMKMGTATPMILIYCLVYLHVTIPTLGQEDGLNEVREELDEPERLLGMEDSDGKGVVWSEDDIIKDADDHAAARFRRQAVASDSSLWPDGQIPYTISAKLAVHARPMKVIKSAIKHWEDRTCIRFHFIPEHELLKSDIPKRKKYVNFKGALKCASSVGRGRGRGEQVVEMGSGCTHSAMIIHELGHLIGLWHEQSRRDRDAHVLVLWNNIMDGAKHNFGKVENARLLAPYDLASMMHYDVKMFSNNGQETLRALDPRLTSLIGRRSDLSFYDTKIANELYECAAHCSKQHSCLNDGFRLSDCTCSCPPGLTGARCERVKTDTGCGGVLEVNEETFVTSPGFPKHYKNNLKCVWLLTSPEGTYMTLRLLELDVEKCKDKLLIKYHNIGTKKGPQFCGNEANETMASVDNRIMIDFDTNSRTSGKGFRAVVNVHPQKDCRSSPCQHGGVCEWVVAIGTYVCDCPDGWVGKDCHIPIVDGAFSSWSEWSPCVASCGLQSRIRSCTSPAPQNGGRLCKGATYNSRHCGDRVKCDDYFNCDFGSGRQSTTCGMTPEGGNKMLDWLVTSGETTSPGTGPPSGHTTGDSADMYYYLEASSGRPWEKAISWLPRQRLNPGFYCLEFFYSLHGTSVSTLSVLRRREAPGSRQMTVWQHTGEEGPQWRVTRINVLLTPTTQVGFMAVKGETYSGDIAIDDISISPGQCQRGTVYKLPGGCSINGKKAKRGPFYYMKGCTRMNCFCNQDGVVDCPKWKTVPNACKTSTKSKPGRKEYYPRKSGSRKLPYKQKPGFKVQWQGR